LQQGHELLMAAEEAAARSRANKRPHGSEAELHLRLDDARKGQIQAQEMLMGTNQLVSMLLVMLSSLHRRCVRLERERDQALARTTSSTESVSAIQSQLVETERRLADTEERLQRARSEREEVENLRAAMHSIAEEQRISMEETQYQTTSAGPIPAMADVAVEDILADEEEAPLWAYDSALEKADAQLSAHQRGIQELRAQVGSSSIQAAQDPQVIRGTVVRADTADTAEGTTANDPTANAVAIATGVAVPMPDLGQGNEATVTHWFKSAGDRVEYDEPLLEVSTDKVETEVRAPVAGVLLEGSAGLDETVTIGEPVAYIRAEPEVLTIRLPAFGEASVVIRWLKGRGDQVAYGEMLLEVLTDPAVGLPAPMKGTLTAIACESGEYVETGTVLGYLQSHWLQPQRIPLSGERSIPRTPSPRNTPPSEERPVSGSADPSGSYVPVRVPPLGENVSEVTVIRWLKTEGDHVVCDEPLLEVGTDKVDTELPAPATGKLANVRVMVDETVPVGSLLANVLTPAPFTVTMPVLSEYAHEATIERWWASTGQFVHFDDLLVEVSTDAADFTLRAETSGVLKSSPWKEGRFNSGKLLL
jgi:pyruvate/2-oxoglutarate dehydrogenase complex dihydrolipoamide acyltransferase (E2) component